VVRSSATTGFAAPQCGDAGRCGGVDDIVFAAATPGQFTNPRRRGRGHILANFTAGDEPVSQVPAQAAGIFRRPSTLGEASRPP